MKVTAIIPAAGLGKRLNTKKQFLELSGKPILFHTAMVFEQCQSIDDIIVVVGKEDIDMTRSMLKDMKKVKQVVEGGAERQDSVYNGIFSVKLESDEDIAVIHDAARPFITKEIISKAVTEAKASKAVVVGVPSKDTVKTVSPSGEILETLERSSIWLVQTPQAFNFTLIKQAYDRAQRVGYKATDDARLVERLGTTVKIIMGSYENIKITTRDDISIAESIMRGREA